MGYRILNTNGEAGLGFYFGAPTTPTTPKPKLSFWEILEKGIEAFGKGKEILGKGEPTVPISTTLPYTPGYPGYDPYAPRPFNIGSLLIPGAIILGGGLLVLVLVKAMKK